MNLNKSKSEIYRHNLSDLNLKDIQGMFGVHLRPNAYIKEVLSLDVPGIEHRNPKDPLPKRRVKFNPDAGQYFAYPFDGAIIMPVHVYIVRLSAHPNDFTLFLVQGDTIFTLTELGKALVEGGLNEYRLVKLLVGLYNLDYYEWSNTRSSEGHYHEHVLLFFVHGSKNLFRRNSFYSTAVDSSKRPILAMVLPYSFSAVNCVINDFRSCFPLGIRKKDLRVGLNIFFNLVWLKLRNGLI